MLIPQLKNHVWAEELRWRANVPKSTFSRKLQKIQKNKKVQISKFWFIEKDALSEYAEVIENCTDLTNKFPAGAFFEHLGFDRSYYRKIEGIKTTDINSLKLIELTDEFMQHQKKMQPYLISVKIPETYANKTCELYDGAIKVGFYGDSV